MYKTQQTYLKIKTLITRLKKYRQINIFEQVFKVFT